VSTKLCARCGTKNVQNAPRCSACKGLKFAPTFVLERRVISRSTHVDITQTNAKFGPVHPRITISKWWRGRGGQVNFEQQDQWQKIVLAVDELGPHLGWKKAASRDRLPSTAPPISARKPSALAEVIAREVDLDGIPDDDYQRFIAVVRATSDVFARADDAYSAAFAKVVGRLPTQRTQALGELSDLLESWSLLQITGVSREVKSRLATLSLFKSQIENEDTYEIRGDKSIHRILENAMWILDENYWLLQGNSSLRKFIGEDLVKKDDPEGRLRPDFVCGNVEGRLIIIEIKRPSKVLDIDDLNQLETYFAVADRHSTSYTAHEGYLVGKSLSPDLKTRLKFRRGMKVLTYSGLIENTERRYKDYLKFQKAPG
jgi:hypothetical protein